jgi:Transglycosylase SLT domain
MRSPVTRACDTAQTSPIPLFAGKPSHPFVPLDDPSAGARSGGQGRPQAGAKRRPLTGASTMARSRHGGDRAHVRCALFLLFGLIPIALPNVTVSAQAAPVEHSTVSDPYAAPVAEASQRFSIPEAWIRAIMRVESRGDRRSVSPKGAMGLMQIMPDTWAGLRARYGLGRNPFDPHDNILAGAAFLREMHDRYGSPGFLAAYNAGPGRYEDYRDRHRPLPPETVAYVAALVPFVDGGEIAGPVLLAASDPSSWTQAPLFIMRADTTRNVDRAAPDRPSSGAPAAVPVRDVSAIVPQSEGLFVALSTTGRTQ